MTDTERLNLIENYGWSIRCIAGRWYATGDFGVKVADTIRETIDEALSAQVKWALQ